MTGTEHSKHIVRRKLFVNQQLVTGPSKLMLAESHAFPLVADKNIHSAATMHSSSENPSGNDTVNGSTKMSKDRDVVHTTSDTLAVLTTLTIIFLTLLASYLFWKKIRSTFSTSHSNQLNRSEEYRYSRLSQNDVEVDNISFQGDLTHKSLLNPVPPVCAEEECEDDHVKPATLCLEYDSLITISNDDSSSNQRKQSRISTSPDDKAPVNLLIDELSDEQDLLQ